MIREVSHICPSSIIIKRLGCKRKKKYRYDHVILKTLVLFVMKEVCYNEIEIYFLIYVPIL